MKELTIEEKAELYDEALKAAIIAHKDEDKHLKATLERIFPDLKENEDERIRKALRKRIINYDPNNEILIKEEGISQRQFLDWLEKQGKIVDYYEDRLDECACKYFNKGYKQALKTQGEQKPNTVLDIEIPFGVKDSELMEASYYIPEGFHAEIECNRVFIKRGEQKPADKVEPKFHEGDWIVFNGLTLYIKEVVKGYYRTISKSGITNSYDWDIDNVTRLWTIQDAKDGDIIYIKTNCSEWLLIFKKIESQNNYIDVYDYYAFSTTTDNVYHDFNGLWGLLRDDDIVCPATKEQRELLFQKIQEAKRFANLIL